MVVVGVLAIQGAVEEHVLHLKESGAETKEIRLPADFEGVDGLVLPGETSRPGLTLLSLQAVSRPPWPSSASSGVYSLSSGTG